MRRLSTMLPPPESASSLLSSRITPEIEVCAEMQPTREKVREHALAPLLDRMNRGQPGDAHPIGFTRNVSCTTQLDREIQVGEEWNEQTGKRGEIENVALFDCAGDIGQVRGFVRVIVRATICMRMVTDICDNHAFENGT